MTEKNKSEKMTNASKPVPMKLFAAWEVDRTPSNCIPRLCTLRITRLRVCGALGETGGGAASGAGAGAVILAARMHSSKRTLRSNDIAVPPLDVELDLCFSLQYPHFVKRDGNRLQIMLQRRKKYKNRTILGYKTLAEGVIRMDQVLQRSMDMELELTGVGGKVGAAAGQPVAKLTITGLASTPVDHDTKNNNTLLITERGYSDEEEEGEFSSVEEADEMTYGAPARRRAHRQLAFNKTDLSYTKLSRSRDLSFMERERKRQSYINSKANDRDSDSELETAAAKRKGSRGKLAQRNLKQKFAALLRRFRVPEELSERGATRDTHHAQHDIDELFQELESLSCGEGEDSGPDQMDTISIGSTPKPSLRPFFSSSRSLANQEHHRHSNVVRHASVASGAELAALRERHISTQPLTESEAVRSSAGDERASDGNSDGDATIDAPVSGASVSSSPPNEIKVREDKRSRLFRSATSGGNLIPGGGVTRKKNSLVVGAERPLSAHELPAQSPTTLEPRRTWAEQVSRLAGEELAGECVGVCGAGAGAAQAALLALRVPAATAPSPAPDPRPLLHALISRAKQGTRRSCIRVAICGGDAAASAALRAHAELGARRPHDAPTLRFYIVPIGPSVIARHLAASDGGYASLFTGDSWANICERAAEGSAPDVAEMSSRIGRYLNSIGPVNNVPIGEAMVAYREKSGDEDASQTFVPFIAEVRVGCSEGGVSSLELEEGGSPPARASPPATPAPHPHVAPHMTELTAAPLPLPLLARTEPLELQLDYWLVPGRQPDGTDSKVTVKASFRALHVTRQNAHLSITYLTKEKKQKIMRLGKKKEKTGEAEVGRAQTVDGVARLICSAKSSHNVPLKVYIDGMELNGVKFFQLSTQWQTHVKTFPVATCGAPLAPPES
ncbi:phosphofurin acidic cluster sorting protein 2 isoform X3 [Spodoptera litura]|uniref:Phosphofurin acidic cluster sorting protein 2 isoform X3 n=1 Tax=Spodoptera litura TaxID=69820 RepID=A0A9J7DVF6_SPOLT|nr:phosphofurin acidic cluster sorting protein 2 isoform X3 [Spodoptera litura]